MQLNCNPIRKPTKPSIDGGGNIRPLPINPTKIIIGDYSSLDYNTVDYPIYPFFTHMQYPIIF